MKDGNVVKDKSLIFGIRIVNMVRHLLKQTTYAEHPIFSQVLKSGTSIGANICESESAESTDDFRHKLKISLKEAHETIYWLKILHGAGYLNDDEYVSMKGDCEEIIKLLVAIINTLNNNTLIK